MSHRDIAVEMPSQVPLVPSGSNSHGPIRGTCEVTLSVPHQFGQDLDRTSARLIRLAPPSLSAKLSRTFSGIVNRAKSGVDLKCWFSAVLLIPCRDHPCTKKLERNLNGDAKLRRPIRLIGLYQADRPRVALGPMQRLRQVYRLMSWFCSSVVSRHNVISPHKQGSFDFSRTRLAFFRDLPD